MPSELQLLFPRLPVGSLGSDGGDGGGQDGVAQERPQRCPDQHGYPPESIFMEGTTLSRMEWKAINLTKMDRTLVMAQILKDMGITEYEPRVINQMLEFAYRYVTTILEDAKIYSSHAKKSSVDADDVRLAIQCRTDQSFTSPPPRDFLLDIARQKNQTPLPLIKPYSGPRLPPDRYCLTAPNYRLKSLQKKMSSSAARITVPRLSVGAVTSRPSTPTLGTPSAQTVSVSTKVGTPMPLTGQRFTVQIPTSQTSVKSATPTTPTVQNVLINPSLIGSKNILITTNMVSSQGSSGEVNPLKRKHEEDDDYDNL